MTDTRFLIILGQKIRKVRLDKNLAQHKLAAMCDFEKASMSRIEAGKTNPTILTLRKISTALEIDIAELLKNEE